MATVELTPPIPANPVVRVVLTLEEASLLVVILGRQDWDSNRDRARAASGVRGKRAMDAVNQDAGKHTLYYLLDETLRKVE